MLVLLVSTILLVPLSKKPLILGKLVTLALLAFVKLFIRFIAKCLPSRLKPLLVNVIYECQSVFVPDRLITDSAIFGYQCVHKLKYLKCSSVYMALKLVMSKAYYGVEWGFIREIVL